MSNPTTRDQFGYPVEMDAEGIDAVPTRPIGAGAPEALALPVKRVHPNAALPSKSFATDAGWDLAACETTYLAPNSTHRVPTGIAMAVPAGWYAQIRGRSGLSSRGIDVLGGVIDHGYTGQIEVILHNLTSLPQPFYAGDRIAQFTLHRVPDVVVVEVDRLDVSGRGVSGFGSTGA